MKRTWLRLAAMLAVIAVAVILPMLWLASYPAQDAQKAAAIAQAARERALERDQKVEDGSHNGWADMSGDAAYNIEYPDHEEQTRAYRALVGWSYAGTADATRDIEVALKTSPEPVKADLATFEAIWPRLKVALSKPNFVWRSPWASRTLTPDMLLLKSLVQSLTAYARYQEQVQHDPGAALETYCLALRLGLQVESQGDATILALGNSYIATVAPPFLDFLARARLSEAECRLAIETLAAAGDPSLLLQRLDEEYALELKVLQTLRERRKPGELAGGRGGRETALLWLAPLRGFWEREQRVLENFWLTLRPLLESPTSSASDIEAAADSFVEQVPSLALPALAPRGLGSLVGTVRMTQTRVAAAELVAGLRLYEVQHGEYPDSLARLVPSCLPEVPKAAASSDGGWNYATTKTGFTLSCSLSPRVHRGAGTTEVYVPGRFEGRRPE